MIQCPVGCRTSPQKPIKNLMYYRALQGTQKSSHVEEFKVTHLFLSKFFQSFQECWTRRIILACVNEQNPHNHHLNNEPRPNGIGQASPVHSCPILQKTGLDAKLP